MGLSPPRGHAVLPASSLVRNGLRRACRGLLGVVPPAGLLRPPVACGDYRLQEARSGLGAVPPGGGAALARRPPVEIERKEREMRGGRRRSGVFLSIKFKKHSERVCSGMVRRFVKL